MLTLDRSAAANIACIRWTARLVQPVAVPTRGRRRGDIHSDAGAHIQQRLATLGNVDQKLRRPHQRLDGVAHPDLPHDAAHARESVDRGAKLRPIVGKVLRPPIVGGEHDRHEIVRTKTIDDLVADPPHGLTRGDVEVHRRVVQDHHEEPAVVELIRRHVGRDLAHPWRRRRRRGRQFDLCQRDDLLRLAVFEHREIRHRQAADRAAIVVEDRDVEVEDLDAGAERRRLLLLKGQPRSARRERTSHKVFQRTSFVSFVSFVVE